MNTNSEDYKYLMGKFSEEKMEKRFEYLYAKMQGFIKMCGYKQVVISSSVLEQAIADYFADIDRLKAFHNIEITNKKKILAYEAYWLLKRKPLQLTGDDDKDVFVNERFITSYWTGEFIKPDTIVSPAVEQEFNGYLKHLFYHLKYRPVDPQNLELILCSFEQGRLFGTNIDSLD